MSPREKQEGLLQNSSGEQVVSKLPASRKDHTVVARLGEDTAARWLEKAGYSIVERNWRNGRHSEIDIVTRDPDRLLTFIEVKTRRLEIRPELHQAAVPKGFPADFEARIQAFEALNWKKRRKVISAALSYIAYNNISDPSCQLDAVVITFADLCRRDDGSADLEGVSVFHVPRAFSDI